MYNSKSVVMSTVWFYYVSHTASVRAVCAFVRVCEGSFVCACACMYVVCVCVRLCDHITNVCLLGHDWPLLIRSNFLLHFLSHSLSHFLSHSTRHFAGTLNETQGSSRAHELVVPSESL